MKITVPLSPKHSNGILQVVLCARISTSHQDVASNAAQHEAAERFLGEEYLGQCEIRRIADQGSGWLAERPGMNQVRQWISDDWCDLVLVNELREVFRNPEFVWKFVHYCLDHDCRFISVNDSIDTADGNWMLHAHIACLRHGMDVPETRRRVRRKATHAFSQGGMVTKVQFGYRKLTAEEAQSGIYGPIGLRIAKDESATPVIQSMAQMLLDGRSFEAIADHLNEQNVDPGPYATSRKWMGGWFGTCFVHRHSAANDNFENL